MKQRMDSDTSIVLLRPFNTFGPYQSAKAVIPELIINCLLGNSIQTTKGEQTREFNYVENIVDGLIKAAVYPERIDGIINIAAGEEIAICDLVKKIAELTDTKSEIHIGAIPYRPNEIFRMYADSTRVRDLLGWVPEISLEQGLKRTVEWYANNYVFKFN